MLLHQFGLGASVLFAIGLVVAAWRRQWLLLGAVLAPFVVLSLLIQNKNLRYSLPLLGAMAVIAGARRSALCPRGVRRGAAVALVLLGAVQVAHDHRGRAAERARAGAAACCGCRPPRRCARDWRTPRSWPCWSATAAVRR